MDHCNFYITGEGSFSAIRTFDLNDKLFLGILDEGTLIGIDSILYGTAPRYTIEARCYTPIVKVNKDAF